MIKELIKLANELDRKGLLEEADSLDKIIRTAGGDWTREDVDNVARIWEDMAYARDAGESSGIFKWDPGFLAHEMEFRWIGSDRDIHWRFSESLFDTSTEGENIPWKSVDDATREEPFTATRGTFGARWPQQKTFIEHLQLRRDDWRHSNEND